MIVGQIVCNFLISPAVSIKLKNLSYDLGSRLVNNKLHCLCVSHDIAVRYGTYPFSFFLTVLDDSLDLF